MITPQGSVRLSVSGPLFLLVGPPRTLCCLAGEHGTQLGLHGASGDGLGDDSAAVEEGETSPDPQPQQGRKVRREACTCPYCKDSEGR